MVTSPPAAWIAFTCERIVVPLASVSSLIVPAPCQPRRRSGRRRTRRGDDGPGLAGAGAAVVVRGIGALRPPIGFVGDAVLGSGHAVGVDAAREQGPVPD